MRLRAKGKNEISAAFIGIWSRAKGKGRVRLRAPLCGRSARGHCFAYAFRCAAGAPPEAGQGGSAARASVASPPLYIVSSAVQTHR